MNQSAVRPLVIAAVTAVAGLTVFGYVRHRMTNVDAPSPAASLETSWDCATEQEWIVAHVVKALANMGSYAQTGAAPDVSAVEVRVQTERDADGTTAFTVTTSRPDRRWRLRVTDYIWSPDMYAPVASDLLGPVVTSVPPHTSTAESITFAALTRPRTDVMVAESQRVSSALAHHMGDAAAHEDAALLLAALALREYSGNYYETRRTLGRLAAHLAVSAALRKGGTPGFSGRFAEITLRTLAFTPQAATLSRLDALDALPNPTPAVRAWSRTLRMRNLEDWRLLPEPKEATLLERLEHISWIYWKVGSAAGLELLDSTDLDEMPDWGSKVLHLGATVEAGHRFVPMGMAQVLQDARSTPLGVGDLSNTTSIVDALNEEPALGPLRRDGERVVVEVLDRGTWAAFVSRHLVHHLENGVEFQRRMLGMPDEAKQRLMQYEKSFGRLRQFPLAARRLSRDAASYEPAMQASLALLAARPEWVGGHNWNTLLRRPEFPAEGFPVPPLERWSTPLFPAGTYFEWPKRLWAPDNHLRVRGPALRALREALPHYSNVVRADVWDRLGGNATGAQLRAEYARLLLYDVNVMQIVANASREEPAEYVAIARRMGDLDGDRLDALAYYYVERGETEKAAAAFEEYVKRARNRVAVSNNVEWLVNHHFDRGNRKRALELANDAAEVYSGGGLKTLARLYERQGQWDQAHEYFRKLAQRYEGNDPVLLAFDLRHHRLTRDERFREERERLLGTFFPTGLETTDAHPPGPPADGVHLVTSSRWGKKAGFESGDVIVSVDGIRVRTYDQYVTARTLRRDPEMKVTVWRKGRYVDLVARQWNRAFGVEARTFRGPGQADKKYI